MPSLFVIQGRDQGTRFEVDASADGIVIGRDALCNIQLHDTEVSRRHAELRHRDGKASVVDLGSSNGVWVNAQRAESRELTSGDRIQIGRTVLLYTRGGDLFVRDADERVSIVPDDMAGEPSHILQAVPQNEASRLYALNLDPTQSNWLARAQGNLQIMYRTALAVSHTLDIDQLLDRLLQLIFEWVEADRGCVMLMDDKTGTLRPRVRRDRKHDAGSIVDGDDETMSISRTILDYVVQRKEGVLSSNARDDRRFDAAASIVRQGVREAICVPMQGRYGMVGAIYIDTMIPAARTLTHGSKKFNEEHLKLMVAIGHQAALAVEDTNYYSAMVRTERLAAMGQTIAFLSHHIKNILQGIRGGGYLIQMGLDGHDEPLIQKGWGIVERNQKRISNMVLDMLTFSKEREPEVVAGDLNNTISEVVELIQPRADEKGIAVDWVADLRLPQLMFDEEGLHRAILNIASNAVDAVEERLAAELDDAATPAKREDPPRIRIRAALSRDARNIRIEVEDSGPGIDAERLAGIFNLFESSKGTRGTGLGLPVSQKILQEHGGQISVESELGHGTRFTLEFPARPSESLQTREMSHPVVES